MKIIEVELTEENLQVLLDLSLIWANEKVVHGYVANTIDDIKGKRIFFAYDKNDVIGYAFGDFNIYDKAFSAIPKDSRFFEIDELYVIKAYRSKGIGKKLFEFVEQEVKDQCEYIVLSTANKNSKRILHFYIEELDMTFWYARLFKKL